MVLEMKSAIMTELTCSELSKGSSISSCVDSLSVKRMAV
jgi:hypothetical protein